MSFNFVVVVTVASDFGAQENKICHCFHFFLFFIESNLRAGTGIDSTSESLEPGEIASIQ